VILDYLTTCGLDETLSTFKRETLQKQGSVQLSSTSSPVPISPSLQLQSLISAHLALRPQEQLNQFTTSTPLANRIDPIFEDEELESEFTCSDKQESETSFKLLRTFDSIHSNNILSIGISHFPSRNYSFNPTDSDDSDSHSDPSSSNFKVSLTKCCVSTSADQSILFFSPNSGEILCRLKGDGNVKQDEEELKVKGHTSAILSTDQNPKRKREFVSCGMDGKIIFWDLVSLKVDTVGVEIQMLGLIQKGEARWSRVKVGCRRL